LKKPLWWRTANERITLKIGFENSKENLNLTEGTQEKGGTDFRVDNDNISRGFL
jgi:hypothetical protein